MEVEGERAKKSCKHHKKKSTSSKLKTRWYKTYVKKEMIAIEKIENTEAAKVTTEER